MKYLTVNQEIIDTVIFDFDGTLAELNIDFDFMRKSIDRLIHSYGIDSHSLKNDYILEKIHEAESSLKILLPEKTKVFLFDAYHTIESIEFEAAERGRLFAPTRELLSSLTRHHIRTGIITRNCSRAVYTVFPDILSFCPVVVCREDVERVKPDPSHLLHVLNLLNASTRHSIMIGDHPLDIKTGRDAGTLTAGVMTGHFRENDFIEAGADIILNQASDILTCV